MPQLTIIVLLLVALALQLMTGNFPVAFFAFPLNLILAVIWVGVMAWMWKYRRKSFFISFMFSRQATVWALAMLLFSCLVIGLTGMSSLVTSWVFAFVLFFFQTVLLFVLFRGWRQVIHHVGLLIVVTSAFWGAPDTETLRLKAVKDVPVKEAFRMDGTSAWLPYEIILTGFRTETYDNGVPSMFEADIIIDDELVTLRVNEPYARSFGEDIYIVSTSAGGGDCVLQIVREPWKYGAVAGIILMLAGAMLLFIEGPSNRRMREE